MSHLIKDHEGNEVTQGRALVNGVRLHYMKAGSGDPVFLLHGVPKTSYITGVMSSTAHAALYPDCV